MRQHAAECCHSTGLVQKNTPLWLKGVEPTHHCDLLSHAADVRAAEVAQRRDGGDASGIHQVPIVVQHVDVHPDLPHLNRPTDHQHQHSQMRVTHLCVCVSPFLQTPHTGTRCRCTWSSSGIAPAVC